MPSPSKTRVSHAKGSEKATFHVSLSGTMLTEFRRQLAKHNKTANCLLNEMVKAEIHRIRRKEAREKEENGQDS